MLWFPWKYDNLTDMFLNDHHINWLYNPLPHQLFEKERGGWHTKWWSESITGLWVSYCQWADRPKNTAIWSSTFRAFSYCSKEVALRGLETIFQLVHFFWWCLFPVFVSLQSNQRSKSAESCVLLRTFYREHPKLSFKKFKSVESQTRLTTQTDTEMHWNAV